MHGPDPERLAAGPEAPLLVGRWSAWAKREFWQRLMICRSGFLGPRPPPSSLLGRLDARHGRPFGGRPPKPVLDPDLPIWRPEALLDFLRPERHGIEANTVRPPRPWSPDKIPAEMEARLEQREAQFNLRNIARLERDTEEEVELQRESLPVTARDTFAQVEAPMPPYAPPELLGEFLVDAVRDYRRRVHHMFMVDDWTRRFGKEIAEKLTFPLWKYDPDAPSGRLVP